ncbi:MAG: major outer membrane protein [Campylobacterota bacterium]|nr:major outer membrane protein [Campylobacterota bacterium]
MKKMIKMSLVAAVAVAGLTTTASAGNLEDMIKDTKMAGYVRYQLVTDHENSTDTDEQAKIVAKITTPVNDMVTANVKMVAGETSTQNADTKAAMNITEGNFVIKAAGATVIAGLQTSQSPFMANNGDTRSHGFTALVPAGPATIAAAYYTTTVGGGLASPAMTNDVLALGALVKAGPANINLWYATVEDGANLSNGGDIADTLNTLNTAFDDASAMSVELTAKAGPVDVQVMHTEVENGGDTLGALTKAVVTGKAGNISYMAAYAMTAEEGGQVTLDNDSDAKSDLGLDNLNMQSVADATAFAVSGKIKMDNNMCASIAYLAGDTAGTDFDELDVKVGYSVSKNFKASLLYAMGDDAGTDFGYSQIELKYTF